jgi:hypothetical protein
MSKTLEIGFYWIEDEDGDICVAELVRYGNGQRWLAPGVVSEDDEKIHEGYVLDLDAVQVLSGPLPAPGPRYHDASGDIELAGETTS